MNNTKTENDIIEIDLLELLKLLWSRLGLIIVSSVLCAAIALSAAIYAVAPKYQSDVLIYVNNSSFSLGSSNFTISSSEVSTARSLVSTYLVILKSRTTLNAIIQRAGMNCTTDQLSSMITSSAVDSTEVFRITVTSTDPIESTNIANAIAEVLPDQISNIVDGSSVRIIDFAVRPLARSSPSYSKFTAIGLAIGFLLACMYIFLQYYFDVVIHNADYLLNKYKLPILAMIPNLELHNDDSYYKDGYGYGNYGRNQTEDSDVTEENKKEKKPQKQQKTHTRGLGAKKNSLENEVDVSEFLCDKLSFSAAEAYKLLRTNINFALPAEDSACRVIGITSSTRNEGKTTTAINLSYTLAEAGKKVLLIDGDMRLPSIASKLSISRVPGFSNFLIGSASLEELLQKTERLPNWYIMAAGSIPPNPSELLGYKKTAEVFANLRKCFDYIVIDLPPVNIVSDALVTSSLLDGMILIVRQNYSEQGPLTECIRQLELSNAKVAGFVLTNADQGAPYGKRSKYYNGGYRKYKKYGYNSYKKYYEGKYAQYGKRTGYSEKWKLTPEEETEESKSTSTSEKKKGKKS